MRFADLGVTALYALLVWAPLAGGAYRGWPLAVVQLLAVLALLLWALDMIGRGRLEWRRTALDVPLGLLAALVVVQLAVGNRVLVAWALAPPAGEPGGPAVLPALTWVGTVSPAQTARSLRLFLTYAAVYVLVVNLARTRAVLDRLLGMLLLLGGALGFAALLDHLAGRAWLLAWSQVAPPGRLSGTFANPDHFAAWLEMLICLGIGYVLGRSGASYDDAGSAPALERLARRYLPMVALGVMGVALVFTLSRGGVVSIAVALIALLVLQGARGRAQWSLVVVGLLLLVVVGYGAWIGLEPLLERFQSHMYTGRLVQYRSTLAMFRAFPLLGAGLGAYRDIYSRYQPAELLPGKMYFPFAHNDLLQLAVELGPVGAALCVFAGWRVAADLVGSHLLGRARCPVGGGERGGARRNEVWSVGVGLGALSAVLVLAVHSAFDFGARIPANGVLAAACLGIATAALHTRFTGDKARLLTVVSGVSLGAGRARLGAARALAVVLALGSVPSIVMMPLVESSLEAKGVSPEARVGRALALAPADPEARWARARLDLARGRQIWDSGETGDGRVLRSWAERRREALPLFERAVADLSAALAARPSDPFLHETLARAHGHAAAIDDDPGRGRHQAAAFAAAGRAIALHPENPYLYRSLAGLALLQREPLVPIALRATRDAIERDPALLPELATRLLPLGLSEVQWAEIVPDSAADRLELAALLDRAGLAAAAGAQYRRAAELLPPDAGALARVQLARSLLARGDARGAVAELDGALPRDPDNPELHLARASALAAAGDAAGALEAYRAALARAEARALRPHEDASPYRVGGARERAVAERVLVPGDRGVVRYRRALGEFLIERKLWAAAAREWEAVVAAAPLDARAHFLLAMALGGTGKPAEAIEEYRRAVALDGAPRHRMALARSLWNSEQYYQAINEWQGVLAAEPGNIEARLALAAAHLRTGERPLALAEYQRVLQLAPDNADARRALGRSIGPVAR